MNDYVITTSRLVLRPFQEKDAAEVFEYTNAQTVNCFADMHFSSIDDVKKELVKRNDDKEYYFAICLTESNKVIGEIFAHPESTDPSNICNDTFSPCWMLHPDYQGKGYAYEAAHAYFNYLFNQKGARRIYAYTEDYNIQSQRLCMKLGMRKEGLFKEFVSFVNDSAGNPIYENTMQYAILKREWMSNETESCI